LRFASIYFYSLETPEALGPRNCGCCGALNTAQASILCVEEHISPTPFIDFLSCQLRCCLLGIIALSICRLFSKLCAQFWENFRRRLPYVKNLGMGHSPNPEKMGFLFMVFR